MTASVSKIELADSQAATTLGNTKFVDAASRSCVCDLDLLFFTCPESRRETYTFNGKSYASVLTVLSKKHSMNHEG